MKQEKIYEYYNANKNGISGALIGLVFAVSILIFGLFNVLFVALCVIVGYYIGKRFNMGKKFLKNLLDRFWPPGNYR